MRKLFLAKLDKPVKTLFETSLEPELTVAYFFTFMQPLFAEEKSPTSESETETLVGRVDPPDLAFSNVATLPVFGTLLPALPLALQLIYKIVPLCMLTRSSSKMSNHLQLLLLPNIAIIRAKRHSDFLKTKIAINKNLTK